MCVLAILRFASLQALGNDNFMTTQFSAGIRKAIPSQPDATLAKSWTRPRANPQELLTGSGLALMLLAAPLLIVTPVTPAQAQESCQVQETSLRDAINSYANSCGLPRVDCDPFDGQWICASFNLTGDVPPQTAQSTVLPTPVASDRCDFSAPTLNTARIGYANSCSLPRVDCDPVDGQWICASYQIGDASPGNTVAVSTSLPTNNPVTVPSFTSSTGIAYNGDFGPPQRAWMDSYSVNNRCYIASNFDHGIGDVQVDTPAGPMTVREVAAALGSGPGVGNNPIYNDVQCGNGPANNAGDENINQCPGRVDLGATGCPWRGPLWDLSVFEPSVEPVQPSVPAPLPSPVTPVTTNSPNPAPSNAKSSLPNDTRYQPGDLIALFYDNAGDRDDGHATVASKMVVSFYGLRESLHIVNGTYDEETPQFYVSDSELVLDATWGSEGSNDSWWNADARRDLVRTVTANRWAETLAAGHKVWVAEGGPSDFTASVLRELSSNTSLNLKNINVVQHSHGFNEDHTNPENLRVVETLSTYHRIGNGNLGGNDTPDLNQPNDAVALRFLADPEFGDEWRAAFDYLPVFNCDRTGPNCKFDGSDAVALMWMVGVQSDEILDWSDFAALYAN